MDWIIGIQKSIDYIEEHITEELDYDIIAAQSFSSSYHFQRVFSILCGFTIGEYIRNRRLSLAGVELASCDSKIIDIALKYGYESTDGFSKAFKKFHGILPSQVKNTGNNLKSFSRLVLKISLEGGNVMNYRIEEKPELMLIGHRWQCTGSFAHVENTYDKTRLNWLQNKEVRKKLKSRRVGGAVWYDVYTDFDDDSFSHIIAANIDERDMDDELEKICIPAHQYAVFETKHCVSPDDEWLPLMKRIVSEWMPMTNYIMSEHPIINKLYFEKEQSKRYMEIWIPVEIIT